MAFKHKLPPQPIQVVAPDPKKAVVYIRVSKNLQDQELGSEAQLAACQAWAMRNGVTIEHEVWDEISGGKPMEERKELLQAIEYCRQNNIGILLCSKIDRFGRNLRESLNAYHLVKKAGLRLAFSQGHSPDPNDPMGEMVFNLGLVFAENELRMIQERTRDARNVLRGRGAFLGGHVPLGFFKFSRDESTPKQTITRWYLHPHPQEQAALEMIRVWRKWGYSWSACSKMAAKEGLLRSDALGRDRPVSHASLWRMMRKELGQPPVAPFGWIASSEGMVANPQEQDMLRMIKEMSDQKVGLHAIAKALRDAGFVTRSAKPPSWHWVQKQIKAMAAQQPGSEGHPTTLTGTVDEVATDDQPVERVA